MKKKIIIVLSIVFILVIGVILFIKFNSSDNKLNETKVVHDIKFSNVKITKKEKNYVFEVKLSSKKDINAESFEADIKDKKGKTITVLSGYIGNINKDEIKTVSIETSKNIKNAYQVVYTVFNK